MRNPLMKLAAAAIVAGAVFFGLGQAQAAPLPKVDGLASQNGMVEQVRRYRYGYGYYPYRYNWRPYRYYAPRYYYYGYRPYWRPYGYYRPYYGRRYWW